MKKILHLLLLFLAIISFKQNNANELTDLLMSKLGVSEIQAKSGTGVLLNYLKTKVSEEDFKTVSDALEGGANSYIKAANDAGAYKKSVSKLGKATSSVNAPGLIGSAAEPFKKLGLKSNMVTQYADVIADYFKKNGKKEAAAIFMKMLN